ncbi:hypothetical protein GZH47_09465 [Paenibacillus rhizovicinus]|uniref:Uncharacterized protein n=1 Tax=Paenibacillus rhizovicinus TaxID=2704463 RepID=A0A6C0P329_9BACL|nr:hypothetical protein [Paenibacillus rhizovicinus]QHW31062.1 hypothetical protein GZH47_09465 [Paenibacillus rhizovicinus]
MDNTISVIVYEKSEDGSLRAIDERTWTTAMVVSLEHVNYITIGNQEYKTLEGRLNLDTGMLEILVVAMRNE